MSYDGAVIERYARAIFELGSEQNQLSQLTLQLRNAAETYAASAELRGVLDNPLVDEDKRESILKDIASRLGLGPLAVNTIRLLASRHRLAALPDIARRLSVLSDEKARVLRATVTSATRLDEGYYQRLTAAIEQATGQKVVLDKKTDPDLIAGVVTTIGDNTIDGSLRGRLRELEKRLISAQA